MIQKLSKDFWQKYKNKERKEKKRKGKNKIEIKKALTLIPEFFS